LKADKFNLVVRDNYKQTGTPIQTFSVRKINEQKNIKPQIKKQINNKPNQT